MKQRNRKQAVGLLALWLGLSGQATAAEWQPVITDGVAEDLSSFQEKAENVDDNLQQLINLEYKDADLATVIRSLSWTYKLNIVTGPDIKGRVTINLQNVTVEKALEAILTVNGLVYTKKDGIIFVSSGDPSVVEIKTQVVRLKYLTATQAQNLARKILSAKGDIKVNEEANTLIVTDYELNIDKIREFLGQIDIAPKQVLIEAKIVDISSSDLRAMGVTWDFDYQPSKGGLFQRNTLTQEQLTAGVNMAEESSSLSGGQLVLSTLSIKGLDITATIDALVKDGKASLLATPSIAVINGQEARIVIGERFPFKERTQTTSGTTETTKFVDIGTTLKVRPQINDDGYITLTLHPEVSSLLASLDAGPRITTREADTTVRIRENETLVIGGLIRQTDNRSQDKVPFLGDIPVLGHLFRRSQVDKEQTELAVFITPRILFSREEMAALGRRKEDVLDATLAIDQTGPLTVVERIFEQAEAMETNTGLESVRKNETFRMAQALSYYQVIYRQFPESRQAPAAKFRAAMIQWKYYKSLKKAKNLFASLASDYPDSEYAAKAKAHYREIEQAEKKR